ncbi:fatty acid synthase, partial [Nephila pilipes]
VPVRYNRNTRTVRSVGIEIAHLNLESVPGRIEKKSPVLEKYCFVPYDSEYIPTKDSSLKFHKYFRACNLLMDQVESISQETLTQNRFPLTEEINACFEDNMNELTDDQYLLKGLKLATLNQDLLQYKMKEWFLSYICHSGKDLLNNALVNEDSLKLMMEIIYENSFKNLSIVEVNRNFPIVSILVVKILRKYSHSNLKKSVLIAPNVLDVKQEILDKYNIQFLSEELFPSISKKEEHDLAISSFTCGTVSELQNLIQTLSSVVKSNGFILLFYKDKANPAELFISSVCGEELQVHSEAVLESVLQDRNLIILSKISDPFGGSLYLIRSPSQASPQSLVQVTKNDYSWVDQVKEEILRVKSGTIWLVAQDSPINGIVGMVNCLKRESDGERIRLVITSLC